MSELRYEIVPGFFIQDNARLELDPASIAPTPPSLGLLSGSWSEFTSKIEQLNSASANNSGIFYKVLFLGRHGQGYHNVAASKYGEQAWDDYWSLLNGDGEMIWGPDPFLTALGEDQARNANAAWKAEVSKGIPLPQKLYSSPMRRAMRTLVFTFDGILTATSPKPVVIENWREEYGEHTCDKRRTRSEIHAEFPDFEFENGFSEHDVLWTPERETKAHVDERARNFLNRLFAQDIDDTYISVTAHGGIINGLLRVIGRGNYNMLTGGK
ncbi:hypothetical protein HETIRDRAFT_469614 [Heterobasidion irregulare TC 32-1]|uniref:Phosphoglycerate mutase-like protein n=1 Tax=Heterobasidion irregulare (strain TC 32-1) TaxID=747525 RepID=W4KR20_HETIT|nr:uncharacterized protein HETIRDRAFT_469614 [Heterobasidion irregulare TC 32-1]ETW87511.1 hypothetical protein HETIRDRAFT_469614 [Heterobasidion irregulare TC 32-1]